MDKQRLLALALCCLGSFRIMKFYQAVNEWLQPLPVKPFVKEQDAVANIKALQASSAEIGAETFYVIEINATSTMMGSSDGLRS